MEDTNARTGAKISVIVPVYKVEPYLRTCIDSILNQTFRDFELILVDDGSPDNCGAICDEYAAKDNRIIVIHKENAGVSAARNTGLDWVFANSNSEWITFVDSDDYIVPPYLEILHQTAVENGADVVMTYGERFHDDSEIDRIPLNIVSTKIMSGRECCVSFYRAENLVDSCPWGMLCRKNTLREERFPVGITVGEDESFKMKMLYCVSKVVILRSWLYGYRMRSSGAMHEPFNIKQLSHVKGIDLNIDFFMKCNETEIVKLARKRRSVFLAKFTLLAYRSKMHSMIPPEYRMPVTKAFFITVCETLKFGNLQYIRDRLCNFKRLTQTD